MAILLSLNVIGAGRFFIGLILVVFAVTSPGLSTEAPAVVIIKNRTSKWRIVVPAQSSPGVKFAAAELQKYIQQISGCRLAIEDKTTRGPAIVIGLLDDLAVIDRAVLPQFSAGWDAYSITVQKAKWKSARVVIGAQNGHGAIYGAYNLLEHVGCRWFYPTEDPSDPEVVPRLETISLKPGSWSVASPMKHRICNGSGWFFEMNSSEAVKQLDWAMKNRYNMMGWQGETSTSKKSLPQQYKKLGDMGILMELEKREMTVHGPAHSFDQFLPNEHFEKHPEWFGLRNGRRVPQSFAGAQFCWSNPDARKQFIDNAEAFITHAPLIHIFCSLPFDGGIACDCDACKKMGASNLLMILMSELIERLKVSRPNLLVEATGGYGPATDPPTQPGLVHPQQRIVWAHWGRYHGWGYDDPRYDQKQNLEKWHKAIGDGLTVCQYYTDNFAEPWVMAPFTIALEGDRKYFLQNRIDSVSLLSG